MLKVSQNQSCSRASRAPAPPLSRNLEQSRNGVEAVALGARDCDTCAFGPADGLDCDRCLEDYDAANSHSISLLAVGVLHPLPAVGSSDRRFPVTQPAAAPSASAAAKGARL